MDPAPANPEVAFDTAGFDDQSWQKTYETYDTALKDLFGDKIEEAQRQDLAKITAFLSDNDACMRHLQAVDTTLGALYTDELHPDRTLTQCIVGLAKYGGFSQMTGAVFTGDAKETFSQITGNRILFKDGISNIHGEFTHSLQWLAVMDAADELGLNTNFNNLASLYALAGTTEMLKGKRLEGETTSAGTQWKTGLFDFVCDAFLTLKDADHGKTNLLHHLFSDTCRSPAHIQRQINRGKLQFLSAYYKDPTTGKDSKNIGTALNPKTRAGNLQSYRDIAANRKVTAGTLVRLADAYTYVPPAMAVQLGYQATGQHVRAGKPKGK